MELHTDVRRDERGMSVDREELTGCIRMSTAGGGRWGGNRLMEHGERGTGRRFAVRHECAYGWLTTKDCKCVKIVEPVEPVEPVEQAGSKGTSAATITLTMRDWTGIVGFGKVIYIEFM